MQRMFLHTYRLICGGDPIVARVLQCEGVGGGPRSGMASFPSVREEMCLVHTAQTCSQGYEQLNNMKVPRQQARERKILKTGPQRKVRDARAHTRDPFTRGSQAVDLTPIFLQMILFWAALSRVKTHLDISPCDLQSLPALNRSFPGLYTKPA